MNLQQQHLASTTSSNIPLNSNATQIAALINNNAGTAIIGQSKQNQQQQQQFYLIQSQQQSQQQQQQLINTGNMIQIKPQYQIQVRYLKV